MLKSTFFEVFFVKSLCMNQNRTIFVDVKVIIIS